MAVSAKLSILSAALIAAACGGTTRPSTPPQITDTPSAAASPMMTNPATAVLPPELVHPWFRRTETVTKYDGQGTWTLLIETPTKVLHGNGWESAARMLDADTLELVVTVADGCADGDTGTYAWTLSASRRVLTLEAQTDECAMRAADLRGDWVLSDCRPPDEECLGMLDPGVHVTNFFTPLVPSDDYQFDPAAMSYRVPDGWSNTFDGANEYTLERPTGPRRGVYMWTDVTIVSESAPCTPQPWAGGRATPAELAAALGELETLEASTPTTAEVGGLQGLSVDLTVIPGVSLPCTGDGVPYQPVLAHIKGSGLQWGFHVADRNRLYFLDLEDGRTLVINVVGIDPDAAQELAEGIQIVESIELRR